MPSKPGSRDREAVYGSISQVKLDLEPSEFVEVRSAAEIMATLDAEGKLDGMPFMPEMLAFCGRTFRVSKRSDHTCAFGQPRRIERTVHLAQLRCDGSSHRGCEAGCLIFWKEAWLRRVDGKGILHALAPRRSHRSKVGRIVDSRDADETLSKLALKPDEKLICQSTELHSATCPVAFGTLSTYFAGVASDRVSGNGRITSALALIRYFWGKLILGAFKKWARAPWNSDRYRKTPATALLLCPGEKVRVRSIFEILPTLDRNGCNRGMEFKAEMFRFCGREFSVLSNMERRIDEHSGILKGFRSPCIVLDGVYCDGQRSFCTRGNYHYWREIWLRRV